MPSIRERPKGSGRWQARTTITLVTGQPKPVSTTIEAPDRKTAQRKAQRWEDDLRAGELSGERGTMSELFDAWLTQKERKGSPSTLRSDRNKVNTYLRGWLGKVDVANVRPKMLDDFYATLIAKGGACQHRPCKPPIHCGKPGHNPRCWKAGCRRGWTCPTHGGDCANWVPCDTRPCPHGAPLAISTVVRLHAIISAALELGIRWGWIARNPATRAEPGRPEVEEVDIPPDEDVMLLLAKAEEIDPRLAAHIALKIEAGQRRGPMHALRWSYWSGPTPNGLSVMRFPKVMVIGPDGMEERSPSKTKGTARGVTLGPHVTAALTAHHDAMFERAFAAGVTLPSDAFMWSNEVDGSWPWHLDSTSHRFAEARRRAGVSSRLRLHDMRHLMASQLLATPGISPSVVKDRGGWSQLHTMLNRYTHTMPLQDQAAAGVVDRILAQPDS